MSGPVIIRLQNLPLEARSIDIRRFFEGCVIPDGGVHIIGGERGDAFIAFQSDEDARLAMGRDMRPLCGAIIKLFLSSKTEMQNVIVSARQAQAPAAAVQPPKTNPLDFLSKYVSSSGPPTFQSAPAKPEVNLINQLTSSINPTILDQLKSINHLLPGLHSHSTPAMAPKTAEPAAKANISIDQILGILQTHLQPVNTPATSAHEPAKQIKKEPSPEPENSYNSQRFNSNRYNSSDRYNTEKNSGYGNDRNGASYNGNGHDKYNKAYNSNNSSANASSGYHTKRKYEDEASGYNNKNYHENKYSNNYQSTQNGGVSPQRTSLDPIIRVKNFSNNCSYKDVRTFLQGKNILNALSARSI